MTLANRGFYPGNAAILDIMDADGNLLYTPKKVPQIQVFDERVAWLISDILGDDGTSDRNSLQQHPQAGSAGGGQDRHHLQLSR